MEFECFMETEDGMETWRGLIVNLLNHGSHYEMRIESRSGIIVIFGESRGGYFACVPDWNAGCHLSHPSDLFWNTEQLVYAMGNEVDGITVASALKAIASKLKIKNKPLHIY